MGIEFELKYRATEKTQALLQAAIAGEERHFQMETTYYDTPDGALSARFYTLRCRRENDVRICSLKYPAGNDGRGEIEVECDNIIAALPKLCKLSGLQDLDDLTKGGLIPVCGAKFHRITKTFCHNGTTMELALDRGVLTGGGKEIPLCEIELELKDGEADTVRTYAAGLAAAFYLEPEKRSKFRRALDLAKGDGSHV